MLRAKATPSSDSAGTALDPLPLLLASASPRRRELLASVPIPLVVEAFPVDESEAAGETPDAYLERVVAAKLDAAQDAATMAHCAILVADTVVVLRGRILGKPRDDAEAVASVTAIAGEVHEVATRFAVAAGSSLHVETVRTRVMVRSLSPDQVRSYVATGEGRDKAGGYAIQGLFAHAVLRVEGSYTNVVGLPLAEVVVALERLGLVWP